jgi:hypothetical protein
VANLLHAVFLEKAAMSPYRKAADVKITNTVSFSKEEIQKIVRDQLEQHDAFYDVLPDLKDIDLRVNCDTDGHVVLIASWKAEKDVR